MASETDQRLSDPTPFPSESDGSSPPTVFMAGDEKLTNGELRALSPRRLPWGHRSLERLADALIMMVDDEVLNIEMTEAFLSEAGYSRLMHTVEPENAISLMREAMPSILLLDLSMPKVSGLDILDMMRADAVLRHIPVIVLTSSTDPNVKLQALSAGAMDFLNKPVDPSELGLRIRNTLAATAYRDYLANHDPLTGLPNKLRYREVLEDVLDDARENGTSGCVLHVGIDRLGTVNDAMGRSAGDQAIKRVAKRLSACVQTEAQGELSAQGHDPSLFRFDGDEFAIVLPYVDGLEPAAAFMSRVLDESSIALGLATGEEVMVTCSVGLAVFPDDGREPNVLMSNAALALRHAKQAGRHRYEFFSQSYSDEALRRLDLGADLRRAFGRDEIELLYERQVDLETGRLVGAQAVPRWNHPSGRVIEGNELLALAGSADLGLALADWSLMQVGDHVRKWKQANVEPVPVGVKLPLSQMQVAHIRALARSFEEHGVLRYLCLDLQQAGVLESLSDEDVRALAEMRESGAKLALDRFGTSAFSLAQLQRLEVDQLKLDEQLLRGMDRKAATIALGIADLARRLDITCVACGLTDGLQLHFLKRYKWTHAQGPIFAAPASGMDFALRSLTRAAREDAIS